MRDKHFCIENKLTHELLCDYIGNTIKFNDYNNAIDYLDELDDKENFEIVRQY